MCHNHAYRTLFVSLCILIFFVSTSLRIQATCCTNNCAVAPYISTRSQTENGARQRVGLVNHNYLADMNDHYGFLALTPAYNHSYDSTTLARKLFGCDLRTCSSITLKGSENSPNNTTDWLADWFSLGENYNGSFCVQPTIQNMLLDVNLYWGLDAWARGVFVNLHAPIVWTTWNTQITVGRETGTNSSNPITGQSGLQDFMAYACHKKTPATQVLPLCYSRLCPCADTQTYLSDVHIDIGWNMLLNDVYHLGLFARGVVPSGNKPTGDLLFEPIVGNGGHWEAGGGLTTHIIMWHNKNKEDHHMGLYIDGTLTHLFTTKQCRFFDLCNKPWSRFVLAAKDVDQETTIYAPIANLTAHEIRVSADLQADITALMNYTNHGFTFDIGYNFWARTCDKFEAPCDPICCSSFDCACSYRTCPSLYCELDGKTWYLIDQNDTIHTHAPSDQTKQYLRAYQDLAMHAARTHGLTHKLFMHLGNTWYDQHGWAPFFGIGGEVEFGPDTTCYSAVYDPCNSDCSAFTTCSCSCLNTAISQWSIWCKGGISW